MNGMKRQSLGSALATLAPPPPPQTLLYSQLTGTIKVTIRNGNKTLFLVGFLAQRNEAQRHCPSHFWSLKMEEMHRCQSIGGHLLGLTN
jgi:hypothetical protein